MDYEDWNPWGFNPDNENQVKELQENIKTKEKKKVEHLAELEQSLEKAKKDAERFGSIKRNTRFIFIPDKLEWHNCEIFDEEVADLEQKMAKAKSLSVWPKPDDIAMHIRYNRGSVHLLSPSEETAMNDLVASGSWRCVKLSGESVSWRRGVGAEASMASGLSLTMSSPCNADTFIPASFTGMKDLETLTLNMLPTCQDRRFLHSSFFPVDMSTMTKLNLLFLRFSGRDDIVDEKEDNEPSKKKQKNDRHINKGPVVGTVLEDRTFRNIKFINITVDDPTSSIQQEYVDDMLRYVVKHFPNVTTISLTDACVKNADSQSETPAPSKFAIRLLDSMQDESVMEPKREMKDGSNQQATGTKELQKTPHPPPLSKLEKLDLLFCGLDETHLKVLLCDILVSFKKKWFPNIKSVNFYGNTVSSLIPIASGLTHSSDGKKTDDIQTKVTHDNSILRGLSFDPKHLRETIVQEALDAGLRPPPEDFQAWLLNAPEDAQAWLLSFENMTRTKVEEEAASGLTIVEKLGLESFGFVSDSSAPRFKELCELNKTNWRCIDRTKRALKIVENINTNAGREKKSSKCNCKWKGTHMCKIDACHHLLEQLQKKELSYDQASESEKIRQSEARTSALFSVVRAVLPDTFLSTDTSNAVEVMETQRSNTVKNLMETTHEQLEKLSWVEKVELWQSISNMVGEKLKEKKK